MNNIIVNSEDNKQLALYIGNKIRNFKTTYPMKRDYCGDINDELREELAGYYKEFNIKSESNVSGLVNDIGEASSDFEDAKTSEEHLSDFIGNTDWEPSMKENVKKLLSEIRERINL